ncbi:MAG: hypothetical protein R3298_05345 [Gammaproteobacteria bacterium]|nr:hypothetical protein [Gammaproteobacteria bacterium]
MKIFMLYTGSGPIVIMTSYDSVEDAHLLEKLASKGIHKFIAHEIPLDLARDRYAAHFENVQRNLDETDDLRVLDYNGERAFRLFRFDELGESTLREPDVYYDKELP